MRLQVYNFTYNLARLLIIILKPLLNEKLKKWVDLRQQKIGFINIDRDRPRLWIHAASGEIEYAKGVIREIKKIIPKAYVCVSYSSPSAESLFKNIQNDVDLFFPLGWDTTSCNTDLIKKISPDMILFSRTDFWPNLIFSAYSHKIPVIAISVNPKKTWLNLWWFQWVGKKMKWISCVHADQVTFLKEILPTTQVEFIPDTRFDQVFHRLQQASKIQLPHSQKLITFGSTWPKDEAVLFDVIEEIFQKNYAIIWAPHEPDSAPSLISGLIKKYPQKKIKKLSAFQTGELFDVLIIDQIGYLADCYRASKISFVGGSFQGKVHSVMEPLCAGNLVIVGPYHQNSPEALQFKKLGYVQSVHSPNEFIKALNLFEADQAEKINQLKKMTLQHLGGSQLTAQRIIKILQNS